MYQIFKRLKGSLDCSILIMLCHNLTISIMCLHEGDVHPMSPCIAQIGVFGPKPKKKRIALFCNLSDCSNFLIPQIPAK